MRYKELALTGNAPSSNPFRGILSLGLGHPHHEIEMLDALRSRQSLNVRKPQYLSSGYSGKDSSSFNEDQTRHLWYDSALNLKTFALRQTPLLACRSQHLLLALPYYTRQPWILMPTPIPSQQSRSSQDLLVHPIVKPGTSHGVFS